MTIYLPDELLAIVKAARGLDVSEVCQAALRAELLSSTQGVVQTRGQDTRRPLPEMRAADAAALPAPLKQASDRDLLTELQWRLERGGSGSAGRDAEARVLQRGLEAQTRALAAEVRELRNRNAILRNQNNELESR